MKDVVKHEPLLRGRRKWLFIYLMVRFAAFSGYVLVSSFRVLNMIGLPSEWGTFVFLAFLVVTHGIDFGLVLLWILTQSLDQQKKIRPIQKIIQHEG